MISTINTIQGVPTLTVKDQNDVGDFILLDVRRPDEFIGELGHIKNSTLHTLGPELDQKLQELLEEGKKDTKILFICRSGARSANSTLQAIEMGFTNVYNMFGGMIYWNESNFDKE